MNFPDRGQYRSIYSAIWDDPEFRSLPREAKLVFFALRTYRTCNFPCIFVVYLSVLPEILNIPIEETTSGIDALIDAGWVKYERPVLWIVKGLKNDPHYVPGNEKQTKGIINIIKGLPKSRIVKMFIEFYGLPIEYDAPIDAPIDDPIEVEKGKGKGKGKGNRNTIVENDNPIDAPIDGGIPPPVETGIVVRSKTLADVWNETVGDKLPRVSRMSADRQKKAALRMKERTPEQWGIVFRKVVDTPFLCGENDRGWRASFDWIIRSDGQADKVLEGFYDRRGGRSAAGMGAVQDFLQGGKK